MTTLYADRAYLRVNGALIADLQSATLSQKNNAKEVSTMSDNRRNKGYVQGNRTISLDIEIAVQNKLARPKLENINYEANNVEVVFEVGAEIFTVKGLFPPDADDSASGVGAEVKTKFKFGALDVVDGVGNSSIFGLVLPS